MESRVAVAARNDETCLLLMTAPGVGPVTALSYKSSHRRSRSLQVFTARRSALRADAAALPIGRDRQSRPYLEGRRSRRQIDALHGSELAPASMHEALPTQDMWLKLVRSKGRRRALVAVARKLAVILHRMWMTKTSFRSEAAA
jgi:hypothetical protein